MCVLHQEGKEHFPFVKSHMRGRRVMEGPLWNYSKFSKFLNHFNFLFSDEALSEAVLSFRYQMRWPSKQGQEMQSQKSGGHFTGNGMLMAYYAAFPSQFSPSPSVMKVKPEVLLSLKWSSSSPTPELCHAHTAM